MCETWLRQGLRDGAPEIQIIQVVCVSKFFPQLGSRNRLLSYDSLQDLKGPLHSKLSIKSFSVLAQISLKLTIDSIFAVAVTGWFPSHCGPHRYKSPSKSGTAVGTKQHAKHGDPGIKDMTRSIRQHFVSWRIAVQNSKCPLWALSALRIWVKRDRYWQPSIASCRSMSSNATSPSGTWPASQPVETCGTKSEFSETSETNQPQIPLAAKIGARESNQLSMLDKLMYIINTGQSGRSNHS